MKRYTADDDFLEIVKDILNHDEFSKTKKEGHHGINRYNHSLKVAYNSYKISKKLNLNYVEAARGALLHDFFLSEDFEKEEPTLKNHPIKSLDNSLKYFDINKIEADIISKHMFPIGLSMPKYKESWVVNAVDKGVSICEASRKTRLQLKFVSYLFFLFFIKIT